MLRIIVFGLLMILNITWLHGQNKYVTQTGNISFYSTTPTYQIKAINNEVFASLNIQNGEFIVTAPIKSFHLEQVELEEKIISEVFEAHLYPTASFKGKLKGFTAIDFRKNGSYEIEVSGVLSMHGISRTVQIKGNLEVTDGIVEMSASFYIKPVDYQIKIADEHKDKLAEKVEVVVDLSLSNRSKV